MKISSDFVRRRAAGTVAVALMVISYSFSRQPVLSDAERVALGSQFKFTEHALPQVPYVWPGHAPQQVRNVHGRFNGIAAWISSVGAAAAVGDLDGDGLANDVCYVDTQTDIISVAPIPSTGNRYAPLSLSPAPLSYDSATMAPMGSVLGDLNEDGRLDILVYYWGRTPIAFLRKDGGYVPQEVVPRVERWYTNAVTQADFDGDGHVDLAIANYFPDGARILDANATSNESMQNSMSRAVNGGNRHFLLWSGAQAGLQPHVDFREVRDVLPDDVNRGWTLAVGAADLNGDLLPEIYFANDFGPDRLLLNRSEPGQLRFDNLTGSRSLTAPRSSVLGRDSFKGMGVDWADINGDGLLDIFVSNITTQYGLMESNFCFLNTGETELLRKGVAPFVNASEQLGLSRGGWAWDVKLDDFNNDGVLEVIQAIGFLKGSTNRWPELQELAMANDRLLQRPGIWPRFQLGDDLSGHSHNPFFVRAGDGRYYDLADEIGLAASQVSRGIAIADVDGDGALDFVVANQWDRSYFYHNDSPKRGSFIGLHVLLPLRSERIRKTIVRAGHPSPATPARAAIGASVTVHLPDGRKLVSQVDGGNGHSGKRSADLHFGIGRIPPNQPISIDLRWRDETGHPGSETISVTAGWYSVLLGSGRKGVSE